MIGEKTAAVQQSIRLGILALRGLSLVTAEYETWQDRVSIYSVADPAEGDEFCQMFWIYKPNSEAARISVYFSKRRYPGQEEQEVEVQYIPVLIQMYIWNPPFPEGPADAFWVLKETLRGQDPLIDNVYVTAQAIAWVQ